MEDLGVVYLYNKEQGMLVGRQSFTFRSQMTPKAIAKDLFPFLVMLFCLFYNRIKILVL